MNHELAVVYSATAAELSRVLNAGNRPVLLKQLASDWPAVQAALQSQDAIQDYLLERCESEQLLVFTGDANQRGRVFYNSDFSGFNFSREHSSLATFFATLANSSKQSELAALYMGSTNVARHFPRFAIENSLALDGLESVCNVWIGNQTSIAAHNDFPDNLAVCVAGKRRVTLFPPEQLSNLYIGSLDVNPAGPAISHVDPNEPDFSQFPKYRQALAHAIQVELLPGDVLFIPSMWWHQIDALEPFNVLVNFWWKRQPQYIPSPMEALNYALLTIKDLPPHQKAAWQTMFEHYVFSDNDFAHIPEHIRGRLGPIDEATALRIKAMLQNSLNR